MTTVFMAGSMNIKKLDRKFKERMANVIAQDYDVIVGDAHGADTSIQEFLLESGAVKVTVYCSGMNSRNNVGHWYVNSVTTNHSPGSRAFFAAKDIKMAEAADFGLMIWDAKSTGTLGNVIELLTQKKNSLVFLDKEKEFKKVIDLNGLTDLMTHMSEHARLIADAKIGLGGRIDALRSREKQLEILGMPSPRSVIPVMELNLEEIYETNKKRNQ
jgi:hypothetical protein